MPIGRFVEDGVVFSPDDLSAMSKALEETSRILGIEADENQRQIVARFIIKIAQEDDQLDAAALRERVFAELGGVQAARAAE
jgi:dephospho-CoA kinase